MKINLEEVIFWDKTGFWLAQKRLEKSTWPWPMTEDAAREIKSEQLDSKNPDTFGEKV